ncbi:hypothetical protein CGCSCA2_v006330 [Colletotrichum siamense]|uniref:Uncharacterized protein n=1 Tax=Colletotrichum siamense TaxID=690259 RepID=A0A9P5ET03_COLSI|nr:hypothetical protein CGCSCA2_v006330 [Colletotrichum siamense]
MVSFTSIVVAIMAATTAMAQFPAPGEEVDCDCTDLKDGEVVPDDDGVRRGCANRGYLVTRDGGDLKCVIVEDGTEHHDRARDFVNNCSLHGTCGYVGQ